MGQDKDGQKKESDHLKRIPHDVMETLHPSVKELLIVLIQHVGALEKRVEELEAENRELRARLNENSSNSSKPPSSDPPWIPKKREAPTGRHRGGQEGHQGHHRKLLPPELVNHTSEYYPKLCKDCGAGLENCKKSSSEPIRHQVVELPPISAEVTEYRLHYVECPCCGKETCADLPEGVTWSSFGPSASLLRKI